MGVQVEDIFKLGTLWEDYAPQLSEEVVDQVSKQKAWGGVVKRDLETNRAGQKVVHPSVCTQMRNVGRTAL